MQKIALSFISYLLLSCATYASNNCEDKLYSENNKIDTELDQIFLSSENYDEIIKLKNSLNNKLNEFSENLKIHYKENNFNTSRTYLVSEKSDYKSKFDVNFFNKFIDDSIINIFEDSLKIKNIYNESISKNEIKKIENFCSNIIVYKTLFFALNSQLEKIYNSEINYLEKKELFYPTTRYIIENLKEIKTYGKEKIDIESYLENFSKLDESVLSFELINIAEKMIHLEYNFLEFLELQNFEKKNEINKSIFIDRNDFNELQIFVDKKIKEFSVILKNKYEESQFSESLTGYLNSVSSLKFSNKKFDVFVTEYIDNIYKLISEKIEYKFKTKISLDNDINIIKNYCVDLITRDLFLFALDNPVTTKESSYYYIGGKSTAHNMIIRMTEIGQELKKDKYYQIGLINLVNNFYEITYENSNSMKNSIYSWTQDSEEPFKKFIKNFK